PGWRGIDLRGQLRRQARAAPLPPAQDHGRRRVSVEVRLRAPLDAPADCSALLAGAWTGLAADALARRPVRVDGRAVPLGDLCAVSGGPDGAIRFSGNWRRAGR